MAKTAIRSFCEKAQAPSVQAAVRILVHRISSRQLVIPFTAVPGAGKTFTGMLMVTGVLAAGKCLAQTLPNETQNTVLCTASTNTAVSSMAQSFHDVAGKAALPLAAHLVSAFGGDDGTLVSPVPFTYHLHAAETKAALKTIKPTVRVVFSTLGLANRGQNFVQEVAHSACMAGIDEADKVNEAELLTALRGLSQNLLILPIGDPTQLGTWVAPLARRSRTHVKKQLCSTFEQQ